ncbi:MAG: hypothetical protein ACODTU_20460 [Pigmentiphaga sp.]|uniref:hypothetical protein n=1 Tax=Pigmentiphaga sp. TaxID=1977564 RepID=UPI003B5695DC
MASIVPCACAPASMASPELFSTGEIVLTPGVKALVRRRYIDVGTCLHRHRRGDWGHVDGAERYINEKYGLRGREKLFSRYPIASGVWLEVWTLCDRSMTVLLLPYE